MALFDPDYEHPACPNRGCREPLRDDGTCWRCDHTDACASMQPGSDDTCTCVAVAQLEVA